MKTIFEGRAARGLELAFIMFEYYSTGKSAEAMFMTLGIHNVRMRGDNLEAFHNTWDMLLAGLPKDPDPDTKQHCYFMQIKGHKGITEDIAHYNRADVRRS